MATITTTVPTGYTNMCTILKKNTPSDGQSMPTSPEERIRTTSEAESISSSTTTSSSIQEASHLNGGSTRHLTSTQNGSQDTISQSSSVNLNACRVFLYTLKGREPQEMPEGETAESVCHQLCKQLNFKPIVELLFGLRNVQDNCFLPAGRLVAAKAQYEFRLRFKVPDNAKLKADKNAFEYYYMQVRHDLISAKYPGINYEEENEKILGLVVADMYLEMIKNSTPVDELCKQYKRFTPKPNQRFSKRKIKDILRNIVRKDYDQYYIMESYLSQVNTIGPYYLREEYAGETDYAGGGAADESTAGGSAAATNGVVGGGGGGVSGGAGTSLRHLRITKQTKCALKIELCPEYRKEPVLKIHFKHTDSSRTYPIKGMNVIVMEQQDPKKVHIEWSDRTQLKLVMTSAAEAESLVSGLATYYRLMDNWTFDLCASLITPSLARLSELRCHGPIGFPAAYEKLQRQSVGNYILRQCDQCHDVYKLDIKTSPKDVRTLKITAGPTRDEWYLHHLDSPTAQRFQSPSEIARSIRTNGYPPIRIGPPSQAGELSSLLLCQKQSETRKKMISGEVEGGPKCIDPKMLLRKETQRISQDGSGLTEYWADWTIDNQTFVEVTLKALKPNQIETNMMAFLNQAQKWCKLESRDILRIYGITLYNPTAMVMERTKCSLAELLKDHRPPVHHLIDATQSLSRALNYMRSQGFTHSKIRCSTLHVVAVDSDKLIVRLGDPGINNSFTEADRPWIPVEYHTEGRLKLSRLDMNTDVWAFATTVWQIFSHGSLPPKDCFKARDSFLPKPTGCPDAMYRIMCLGWQWDAERRFEPQQLFTWLYHIRQQYEHYYMTMGPPNEAIAPPRIVNYNPSRGTSSVGSSVDLYCDTDSETITTEVSQYEPLSTPASSNGYDARPLLGMPDDCENQHVVSYLDGMGRSIETDTYTVVLQGLIGSGHYGAVFKGEMWYTDSSSDESTKVAVKMIRPKRSTIKEFQEESKIMKAVDHKNIVKILDFYCESHVAIIVEYMPRGNLGCYVAAQRHHLTTPDLLRFARDIANGMEYLQLNDIVHRDLAARNVLVDADETLKISDFGLARWTDGAGYYVLQDFNKELPVHYYAPETFEQTGRYSIKSDVWSYGITLYEIFKREDEKMMLVPDSDVQALLKALFDGKRLPRSETCPQVVYDQLMMPCWEFDKERRPTFTVILKTLDSIAPQFGEAV